MMDAEVALPCAGGSLLIGAGTPTAGGDRWCSVSLVMGEVRRPLGAQTLSYLRKHLGTFLDAPPDALTCVFALSEIHTCGYGELRQDGLTLKLQDRNAVLFATLVLAASDRETWHERLAAFQPSDGPAGQG